MFIGIILGFMFVIGVISVFSEVVKKVLEVISFLSKWCLGITIVAIIAYFMDFQFDSGWGQLAYYGLGGLVAMVLIMMLAGCFRLVGYSINFLIDSLLLMAIALVFQEKVEITFLTYCIALILFPRVMWLSDRFATTTNYDHTEYGLGVITEVFHIMDVDWWEDFGDSWHLLPLQIIVSFFFYAFGCLTMLAVCPMEGNLKIGLYLFLAPIVNILIDLCVFRFIEGSY